MESTFPPYWMIFGFRVPLLLHRAVCLTVLSHKSENNLLTLLTWAWHVLPYGVPCMEQAAEPAEEQNKEDFCLGILTFSVFHSWVELLLYFPKNWMGDFPGGPEVRLPMQGSLVRSLVREDPTCHRATKTLQLLNLCSRAQEPQLLSPSTLEPMLHNKRSHSNEKRAHCNETAAPTHCN